MGPTMHRVTDHPQHLDALLMRHLPASLGDIEPSAICVAPHCSQAREQVLRQGSLQQAQLASVAIPDALPPVIHDGDLLCDGGTFNDFPVDMMRGHWGVGRVIGVDLSLRRPRRIEQNRCLDAPAARGLGGAASARLVFAAGWAND